MKWCICFPLRQAGVTGDSTRRWHGGSFYGLAQLGAPGSLGDSVLRRPLVILSILGVLMFHPKTAHEILACDPHVCCLSSDISGFSP